MTRAVPATAGRWRYLRAVRVAAARCRARARTRTPWTVPATKSKSIRRTSKRHRWRDAPTGRVRSARRATATTPPTAASTIGRTAITSWATGVSIGTRRCGGPVAFARLLKAQRRIGVRRIWSRGNHRKAWRILMKWCRPTAVTSSSECKSKRWA